MPVNQTGVDLANFLSYLSQRQEVISSNIANADTPGYKTRDVEMPASFTDAFQEARATVVEARGLVTRNDGNNVCIDREARLLAENRLKFNVAAQSSAPELKNLRSAIEEGRVVVSLFGAIAISASGMEAQRARAELITENLANADTTRTPEGGPYQTKGRGLHHLAGCVFVCRSLSMVSGTRRGVAVSRCDVDDSDPERRYLPGHPDADAQGYVAFPEINPAEEMVDLLSASRGYQANVAAISAVKDMIARSIDLFR